MTVKVILHPGEDGYVVAECPSLPGCASQGRTREEALVNIREAIGGWLAVQKTRGAPAERLKLEIVELVV